MREEPFTPRERSLFSALLPPLTKALALRRQLIDGRLACAGLAAALDAIGVPAFVADTEGRIEHASASGKRLADRAAADVRARLRDAIAPTSLVARLDGASSRFLVVLRDSNETLAQRLSVVAGSWGITAREMEVLRWLVSGDANKEIALKLRIHEGSVERHVTSLLRKARCDSRGRLVARFWMDA
jgi:DNA-binding CsgD family transcriptional regulator